MTTEPKLILLIGSGGSGKSTLLMQLPKLALINCDRNLAGPIDYLSHMKFNPDVTVYNVWQSKEGTPNEIHACYDRLVEILTEIRDLLKKEPGKYSCVAVDGLSMVGDFIKQKIFFKQKREAMESRDWDTYKSGIVTVVVVRFREIQALGANCFLTCHEKFVTKKDPKDMMAEILIGILPNVQGESERQLAGMFTDAWAMESRPAGAGKVEFLIKTVKDGLRDLKKSSYKMPSEIIIKDGELVWPKIKEYIQTN